MDDTTETVNLTTADFAVQLAESRPDHPALARVHERLQMEETREITSYDRMHHRHNRH